MTPGAPKLPLDTMAAALGDVTGALRRRREGRETRAVVYDEIGRAWVLDPARARTRAIVETAEAMLDVVAAPEPPAGG